MRSRAVVAFHSHGVKLVLHRSLAFTPAPAAPSSDCVERRKPGGGAYGSATGFRSAAASKDSWQRCVFHVLLHVVHGSGSRTEANR